MWTPEVIRRVWLGRCLLGGKRSQSRVRKSVLAASPELINSFPFSAEALWKDLDVENMSLVAILRRLSDLYEQDQQSYQDVLSVFAEHPSDEVRDLGLNARECQRSSNFRWEL